MRALSAVFVGLALLGLVARPAEAAEPAEAARGREVTVTLPRALQPGDTVFIQVQLGVLARGQEIEVTTAAGRALGVISPHGVRTGEEAGTYTLPVPLDAMARGQVILRFSLSGLGQTPRAPTAEEMKSVRVKIDSPPR